MPGASRANLHARVKLHAVADAPQRVTAEPARAVLQLAYALGLAEQAVAHDANASDVFGRVARLVLEDLHRAAALTLGVLARRRVAARKRAHRAHDEQRGEA